ncbi:type II toxin-antitoxin system HicB family antitoxin [Leptotrichia sp. OH3620_COT-345]|uniref:type II toxin-antitoxin system HicB family antitoxin n=1 Tax=Leptotrichia sp. OH3620_COT-345 TaxID=2491048 RepID=UPI000F655391|nr:type II toxin-antitoxin system HicB family antitoxin [Leptotrichia sp. OH3620_COT-345]RRD39276.1 type II toxin-antitoxin system HicB family antitoxin [Leptotrichia sp. OH3620_COT-345]
MVIVYPAIFHKAVEGGYVVIFPDLNNGATQGETLEEAIEMAQDYIGTYLYDDFLNGNELPKASSIEDIKINLEEEEKEYYRENESFTSLVNLNMKRYVNECKSQTVRKNVSIPSWLNEMAKRSNINFSNVLQEALKQELGID